MLRILTLLLLLPVWAQAQMLNPVKWSYKLEPSAPKVGQTAEVVFTATIDAGWHLYANDFSPDVGPIPLSFAFMPDGSYELLGKAVPQHPHHYDDPVFQGPVSDWSGTGVVRQKIKVKSLPLAFAGTLDGQACTDAGKCVPLTDDFNLRVAGKPGAPTDAKKKDLAAEDKSHLARKGQDVVIDPFTGKELAYSDRQRRQMDSAMDAEAVAKTSRSDAGDSTEACTDPFTGQRVDCKTGEALDSAKPSATTVAKVDSALKQGERQAETGAPGRPAAGQSLWSWFWVAFGSGLVALLTPCVYPMVPMTVSFFTRGKQSKAKGLGMAALFGLSIVALYVIVGVVFSRIFGGDVANDIATHWLPNLLFFTVFLLFGFSFLGYFEITLPSRWSTTTDTQAEKGGIVGIFFMALTLVIVSFSCTGPIASGILLASSQGALAQPIVAMLGFSLAFALPFSFFAAFPQAMQALPRSGGWLNSVKVVLGFVELALALKFLSVADLAYHWHLLDREVYLSLWIVIFSMLGLYLLGKIRFPHDSAPAEGGHGSGLHWLALTLAIAVFSFVVYLVPGLWGAPLRALSGYLPPLETQDFRPAAASSNTEHPTASSLPAACPAPRYADFLHLPHGLQGYFDLEQALTCAKATGKPVFIDFTGHGCTNCREMEARVWSQPAVLERLRDKFTMCTLYVDDRTALPAAEQYTSRVDNKLKATIGKRNLDMEVERFNSNAQPQYVILSPEGKLLEGPRAYDLDVEAFAAFLDAGLRKM